MEVAGAQSAVNQLKALFISQLNLFNRPCFEPDACLWQYVSPYEDCIAATAESWIWRFEVCLRRYDIHS